MLEIGPWRSPRSVRVASHFLSRHFRNETRLGIVRPAGVNRLPSADNESTIRESVLPESVRIEPARPSSADTSSIRRPGPGYMREPPPKRVRSRRTGWGTSTTLSIMLDESCSVAIPSSGPRASTKSSHSRPRMGAMAAVSRREMVTHGATGRGERETTSARRPGSPVSRVGRYGLQPAVQFRRRQRLRR